MNIMEFQTPAPYCVLLITHPARANDLNNTDVAETFNRHSVYQLGDDFDRVQAEDWLDRGFKS